MFSIIVPTFNNLDYLKLCLMSLKKIHQNCFKNEIIIHINEGLIDGTKSFLKNKFQFTLYS